MAPLASKGGQTLLTVSTARQEISVIRRDGRSGFQWIHLEKNKTKQKRNSHGQQCNEWLKMSLQPDHCGCAFLPFRDFLMRQRRMQHATSKEYSKSLEKHFSTAYVLGHTLGSFTSFCFQYDIPETIRITSSYHPCDTYHTWKKPRRCKNLTILKFPQ